MIETDNAETIKRHVINQQLFSEAYLQELRTGKFAFDTINACYQTIREWREEYADLRNQHALQNYVGQCFSTLGFPYTTQTDGFTLYLDETREQPVSFCLLVDDTDLGRATKGRHYQVQLIKQLRNTSLHWGVITNGTNWRLCYADATAPYEVYLQIDLDTLLTENHFTDHVLFYLFFGQQAFTTIPTKGNVSQRVGLDLHLQESEKRAEAIQRYLRGRVESILQALCLGFVQDDTAGFYTEEKLAEIYQNAIYLLYRLLFLFYAEARELLPINDERYRPASLAGIVKTAYRYHREGQEDPDHFSLWRRLTYLFAAVDEGKNELGVSQYNGGLFDDDKKPYLKTHQIANVYLARALFESGYIVDRAGNKPIPIDYLDLSVRHLGTLYEGLLEYKLQLVENEPVIIREQNGKRIYMPLSKAGTVKRNEPRLEVGEVYFADDKGERKSSGSYYTPEDVVQYIVSNTVVSKLEERRTDLEKLLKEVEDERIIAPTSERQQSLEGYVDAQSLETIERKILSLRILDPAMGSAHFLVAAGQVVTNFIVETLNLTSWPNDAIITDALLWKRRVVERCLYGVDVNPLAQELAKLSLWLSSASVGKPLTFLDHHLKIGNSLYGAPLNKLSTLPTTRKELRSDLFQEQREQSIELAKKGLKTIAERDSERIEDVKDKDAINLEVEKATQGLRAIAHVWLATLFGLHTSQDKALLDNEYSELLVYVTNNQVSGEWETLVEENQLLHKAHKIADNERFFHWELEFPDTVKDGKCEFDVIIGNPPYVGTSPNSTIITLYNTAQCRDIYAWLFELALKFAGIAGNIGMIVPLSLTFSRDMKSLRKSLIEIDANTYVSSFDATRDGIFQPNGESRNGQRVSIVIQRRHKGEYHIYTTNLMRWIGEERPYLIPGLRYADVTLLTSKESFPKLGNPDLVAFWQQAKNYTNTVGNTIYRRKKKAGEQNPPMPPQTLYHLYISGSTRYFITAMPDAIRTTGLSVFPWEDKWTRDVAMVALNSNVFYWLWCTFGDGFHVTSENVETMVIPKVLKGDTETLRLHNALLEAATQCVTYHNKWGEKIPNYNFNKRMDILLDIDAWIVRHIAPGLDLPHDIFAQYKSNSFLRRLNLSSIIEVEEKIVEGDE